MYLIVGLGNPENEYAHTRHNMGFDAINEVAEKNNINIIYSDKLLKKTAIEYSKDLSNTLYWEYSKELIGSISYYKEIYDGVIFLTTFPCGVDSLVNELMIRKITKPTLNIIIDSNNSMVGLETRLESFIDILKERKNNE